MFGGMKNRVVFVIRGGRKKLFRKQISWPGLFGLFLFHLQRTFVILDFNVADFVLL
jgi:hypothetical protein